MISSLLNAMLADVVVVIPVTLQHDLSATAFRKSVGHRPDAPLLPAELDEPGPGKHPAPQIGAALKLVTSFKNGVAK